MLNQILVGVSTRNYESSLDKPSAKLKSRGTSKSAASRHLVSQTTKKLEEYLSRGLEEFELAALMMDGLEVAGQTVVVTLGITIDGTKVPLGIWLGSTENSRVALGPVSPSREAFAPPHLTSSLVEAWRRNLRSESAHLPYTVSGAL